jgi:hypothetical protein
MNNNKIINNAGVSGRPDLQVLNLGIANPSWSAHLLNKWAKYLLKRQGWPSIWSTRLVIESKTGYWEV